jgi:quercetin dioxygenase-like cupin family protein
MSETTTQGREPRMSFLAPETYETGMRVSEFDLPAVVPSDVPFKGSYWTVEPGGSSPEDVHSVHEMWLVASGQGELLYGGRRMRVKAGDVVYFEPHQTHEVHNDGDAALAVFSVWWPS